MAKRLATTLLLTATLAAAVWLVPKGAHLLTCLDSERPGCPDWCWTCDDPEPCESAGGVKAIKPSTFTDLNREYICKDGTVE